MEDEFITDRSDDSASSDSLLKQKSCFSENPYRKALENARDIECKFPYLLYFRM